MTTPTLTSPPCPTCNRPATESYAPFCSKRCQQVDLNRWFSEGYRVATEAAPDSEHDDAQ